MTCVNFVIQVKSCTTTKRGKQTDCVADNPTLYVLFDSSKLQSTGEANVLFLHPIRQIFSKLSLFIVYLEEIYLSSIN